MSMLLSRHTSRRQVLAGLGVICCWPVEAQQTGRVPRIALVHTGTSPEEMTEQGNPAFRALLSELQKLGYVEGRTVSIERWSTRKDERRLPEMAAAVAKSRPDVIFAVSARLVQSLQQVTSDIPI